LIAAEVDRAARVVLGETFQSDAQVKTCAEAKHGDFQTNVAMVYGKSLGRNPRDLAASLVQALGETPIFSLPEIAGPGFINFRLKAAFCSQAVNQTAREGRLGVARVPHPKTVVLDYSGPNIAKEMHVGHIRSTILGEALARVWKFLGHTVITDNHLGDWGTQFGKILVGYKKNGDPARLQSEPVLYLEQLYQEINLAAKTDETIQEQARIELVKLQQGDAENLALWRQFVEFSLVELGRIYQRLGVHFDYTLGESFFNDRLDGIVKELVATGVARESEGAICVFFDGDPNLQEHPFLIQKSDEGFLYGTTDLAALQYRVKEWAAQQIIYVTDGRQQLHFQQLFATARKWGISIPLEHVWFGAILGEDKKPIKTREGQPIKLRELLDEAERRAQVIIDEKRPELPEAQRREIARVVGLGALKYADLAQNRNLDYVFNWNKLLAFEGNTAPYLQNAYVRIKSILRKRETAEGLDGAIQLSEEAELVLGKKLLEFGDVLELVIQEERPHFLCVYLHELATHFHKFYEHCPVLKADGPIRASRLALCALVAETLRTGLDLLGIELVEEM
jgi:arginyl-tRNA synthetase